jgi:hypothetical protein
MLLIFIFASLVFVACQVPIEPGKLYLGLRQNLITPLNMVHVLSVILENGD